MELKRKKDTLTEWFQGILNGCEDGLSNGSIQLF